MICFNSAEDTAFLRSIAETLSQGSTSDEAQFRQQLRIVKDSPHSFAGICEGDGARAFVKCYQPKNRFKQLLSRWQSPAKFFPYQIALELGRTVPVPRPLAVVKNASSGNRYYFSEYVKGVDFATGVYEQGLDPQPLLAPIADQLARCHQHGWCHGDFKWGNVFITESGRVMFIDLDGVSSSGGMLGRKRRWRDLARFVVNVEDFNLQKVLIHEFLQAYALTAGTSEALLLKAIQEPLQKFREKHDKKYGTRQADLI